MAITCHLVFQINRVHATSANMQPISDAEQRIIIRMSSNFHPQEIATYTGVSKCTIEGIISHFQQTGDIKTSNTKRPSLGNGLNSDDVQVFHLIVYSYF